jgi:aldose 1-epimerase
MEVKLFGILPNGKPVHSFTFSNARGMRVVVLNYGGIVQQWHVPGQLGELKDVVVGYDTLEGYLSDRAYVGAIIGRYANRIARGHFSLHGKNYELAINNGENHLHGGLQAFDKQVWDAEPVSGPDRNGVLLQYHSPDGEEGYPGNLNVQVSICLTENNELIFDFYAETDQDTHFNMTHHGYFNLSGHGGGSIHGHELMIRGNAFTATDAGNIPTGEIRPVEGTPFDFRKPKPIGRDIGQPDQQLLQAGGYDHNWVLEKDSWLALAARVKDPASGRVMEVLTTQPGIQFYSANGMEFYGKEGVFYQKRHSFCLETQHYADSPNHPEFPSTLLSPGTPYLHTAVYRFSTEP